MPGSIEIKDTWLLFQLRFMFHVIYLLNRMSRTPKTESNWSFEYEIEQHIRALDPKGKI